MSAEDEGAEAEAEEEEEEVADEVVNAVMSRGGGGTDSSEAVGCDSTAAAVDDAIAGTDMVAEAAPEDAAAGGGADSCAFSCATVTVEGGRKATAEEEVDAELDTALGNAVPLADAGLEVELTAAVVSNAVDAALFCCPMPSSSTPPEMPAFSPTPKPAPSPTRNAGVAAAALSPPLPPSSPCG